MLSVVTTLGACDDRPAPRSLKDQPSLFRENADAPVSRFAPAAGGEGLSVGHSSSSFNEAQLPGSMFRAAEVAPERLALTGTLLSELKARQVDDQSIVIDLPADVLFDFDKAELRPDSQAPLSKTAQLIASYPNAALVVNGHTDAVGKDAYNDNLSRKRARAVADWIERETGRTPTAAGFGKRRPIAPNAQPDGSDDPQGRQRNRRVEILIRPLTP